MKDKRFMTEELKTLLKTLAIRMVDAMDLWGNANTPRGAKPTWSEKEHAMTEYMASRKNVDALLGVVYNDLSKLSEDVEVVGLVTVKFIVATCHLLEEYRDIEFPEDEDPQPAAEKAKESDDEDVPVMG